MITTGYSSAHTPGGVRNGQSSASRRSGGGAYSFAYLAPGDYTVCIQTAYQYAVPGCYGGSVPSAVTVAGGELTGDVAIQLAGAGGVDGIVSDSGGTPLSGVTVTATSGGATFTAQTADDGSFRIAQLPADQYTICFQDPGHADQCYANSPDPAGATSVSVTLDATQTISATLS